MTTINTSTTTGLILNTASYTNPIAISAGVTITSSLDVSAPVQAAFGSAFWTIENNGTISGNSTQFGLYLGDGGLVTNAVGGLISSALDAAIKIVDVAGTVVNSGSIGGGMSSAAGVDLVDGGSVTNAQSASITGDIAVYLGEANGLGTVVNDGIVGDAVDGVRLSNGGTVTNAAHASIAASNIGIGVYNSAGTVFNYADITVPGSSSTALSFGVELGAGGSLTNAATGSITAGHGVSIPGGIATVLNNGSIVATRYFGVLLGGGGSVTNADSATISGESFGVAVENVPGTVVNNGSIANAAFTASAGYAVLSGAGVYVGAGGSVTNAATASIAGSRFGVAANASVTLVNDGNIAATNTTVVNSGANFHYYGSGVYAGGGSVTNVASASITGAGVGVRVFNGTLTNGGTITGNNGTAVDFGGFGSNLLVLEPSYRFSGKVVGAKSASNTLELASAASAGTVAGLGTQFTNFGPIVFDAGAQWSITGNTVGLAGTITGFAAGDTIEVTGVTANGSIYVGGVLTLDEVGGGTVPLALPGSFTTTSFNVAPISGGTEITLACFAAGTRLLTVAGEAAVETLTPGDLLVTRSGRLRPVQWIGHRRVALAHHPRPEDVCPVRVRAHSFAPDMPHRDLLVSPDHSVFVDGVLIPVRHLLNGATIVQEAVAEITYFHVELPAHDVLIAEGLCCESYLDTGNRAAFANGGIEVMAHADFALGVWQRKACAPLLVAGTKLALIRQRLLHRAAALGHAQTGEPDLHLLADGVSVWPEIEGAVYRFSLPSSAAMVRLVSRGAAPAELTADSTDRRRLGVAVARLAVDGREVRADDPRRAEGWYPPEAGWQWTDGDAVLRGTSMRRVEVTLLPLLRYWQKRPSAGAAREIA